MAGGGQQKLSIGILGCRGIPNHYGGYEQFAQHLSRELVHRGHQVWVYSSSLHPFQGTSWKGVQLIHQPDPENRLGSFGQFLYDYHCLADARRRGFDVLLQLGYTSNTIWFPLWPRACPNIIHMDGLEWKRAKYSMPVRWFLRKMESWAARRGDMLVADSTAIQAHIRQHYGREAAFIAYGAPGSILPLEEHLLPLGLHPGGYYLAIARFVPENKLETVIQGYLDSKAEEPLLVLGEGRNKYGKYLRHRYAAERVRFPGAIYEQEVLHSLRRFARLYFHGHSVGGTNPSLLEAMACRVPVCAHDNPFNRAVLDKDAFYFHGRAGVSQAIHQIRGEGRNEAERWAARNEQKIQAAYRWEQIASHYEALFYKSLEYSKTHKATI